MDEIYKYHKNGDEWVIRRHHLNGYEGVGAANGEIEARAICAGMNASIRLVLWSKGGDDPESLSMAVESAKRSLIVPKLIQKAIQRAQDIVAANEWEGDMRVNMTKVIGAGRVLSKRVDELSAALARIALNDTGDDSPSQLASNILGEGATSVLWEFVDRAETAYLESKGLKSEQP